jgi:hypothetical protein
VTSLGVLRRRSWLALRAKVDEQTADTVLLSKLRSAFEERFRYDAHGVPRVWAPEDDIDDAFMKAKDEVSLEAGFSTTSLVSRGLTAILCILFPQTLVLLPIYSNIAPTDTSLVPSNIPSDTPEATLSDPDLEFDFAQSLVVLSPTKAADIETRFRREADALFVEAKRSLVVSHAAIPVWIWGAICLLGYVFRLLRACDAARKLTTPSAPTRFNEFMAVLTSPLYFTTLLVLIVSAYFVHRFGLSGPLISVCMQVYKEVHRQVLEKLREAFANDGQGQGARQGSYEMKEPRLIPAPSGEGSGLGREDGTGVEK